MMDAGQDLDESSGDNMKILQCQRAFIQLVIREDLVYQILNKPLKPGMRWVFQCAGCCFYLVGQHYQRGFLCLRLGSGISEMVNIDRLILFLPFRFFIKKTDIARAMMLFYGIDDFRFQLVCTRELNTVFNV